MIMSHLKSAVERVREMGYTPIYAALYGSQNYGFDIYTDTYQSDYDVKIIVMPTLHDLVFKEAQVSMTVDYEGGQIDIKDAISMTNVLCKMNPGYLEILLTPFYLVFPGGEYMEEIRDLLPQLLTERAAMFAKATYGHFQQKIEKAQKLTPSSEEKIRKYGYDGKQLHHALRLKLMLEDFEKTRRMVLHPSVASWTLLKQLKQNEISLEDAISMSQQWRYEITDCANRIISLGPNEDAAYNEAMNLTKRALYFALRAEASSSISIMEAQEVSKSE